MLNINIDENVARKVLRTVDKGLSSGLGNSIPGEMCVEAAVCYALGLPHGDDPKCVAPVLRSLKIQLNDFNWSSKEARAKGLRRLAVIQLGSKDNLDEALFNKKVIEFTIKTVVAQALRSAASCTYFKGTKHESAMLDAALACEKEGTKTAVYAAAYAAHAAVHAAAHAAAYAAHAAHAAAYAAHAAAHTAHAASYAAHTANAAAHAANAANAAANAATRDKILFDYAEGIVQILIEMNVPGKRWLYLTED